MATVQSDCGACPSKNYCPPNTAQAFECPEGYYCPKDTEVPIPCPRKTFGSGPGLSSVGECTNCPGGRFCMQTGLSTIFGDGNCDPGFTCDEANVVPYPDSTLDTLTYYDPK